MRMYALRFLFALQVSAFLMLLGTPYAFVRAQDASGDVNIEDMTEAEVEAFNNDFAEAFGALNTPEEQDGAVSCFDYYRFNSVQAEIEPSLEATVPGTPITFTGSLVNENAYPIVDGTLYVKVFKARADDEKHVNGLPVVDQFVAGSGVTLPANGTMPITFDWDVPAWAEGGQYQVATFFVSSKRYNLLGLSFTDDVVGNTTTFEVLSDVEGIVAFDKDAVTVAGNPYFFAAFPPHVTKDEPVTITATVRNTTAEDVVLPVTARVYSWDAMNAENFIETLTERVFVVAGSEEQVSFTITNTEHPVYLTELSLNYFDTESRLNVRFARDGISKLRLNFPAVGTYPLMQGEAATVFACFHNMADTAEQGTVRLSVLDELGRTVHQYEYNGVVRGEMSATMETFKPTRTLSTFVLQAELLQNGVVTDEVRIRYDCEDFGTCDMPEPQTGWIGYLIGLAALLGVVLVLAVVKRILTKKGIEPTV